jgi:hypothetical protein
MDLTLGRPGPSVQEVFAADVNPAPAVMLTESPATNQPEGDLSIERCYSKDWHDREVAAVWRKCIQKGLRASRKPGITLARYQESRIRHFHATLDDYMNVQQARE